MRRFALALLFLSCSTNAAVPMPKPHPGDLGTYTLLAEVRRVDGIVETVHRRSGPAGETWSWNEIRCGAR